MDFTQLNKQNIYNYIMFLIKKNYAQEEERLKADEADEEAYECMNNVYSDYYAKLEYIKKVNEKPEIWTKYVNLLMQIQNSGLDDIELLETFLSAAVIIKSFRNAYKLSDINLLMTSFCSRELEIGDYSFYMQILTDEEVATRITNKTPNLKEEFEISEEVMGYLDDFEGDCIHADDHEPLRKGSLEVIDSYEISRVR